MAYLQRHSEALLEAARLAAVDFLRTELRVANTMLDVASTGFADVQARERRHAAARIAYAEVVKHLVTGSNITFTDRERDELTTGLDSLARRFDPEGESQEETPLG